MIDAFECLMGCGLGVERLSASCELTNIVCAVADDERTQPAQAQSEVVEQVQHCRFFLAVLQNTQFVCKHSFIFCKCTCILRS